MATMTYDFIRAELGGLYGERAVREMGELIRLYDFYDGKGQNWTIKSADEAGYSATKLITNLVKKLIDDESRFFCSRSPEIRIVPGGDADTDAAKEIEAYVQDVLAASRWQLRLMQAARDCFIGRRVALRLSGAPGKLPRVHFAPSLEFAYDVAEDDTRSVNKALFFWAYNDETDKAKQRIWRQRYWNEGGRCVTDAGVYDGYGALIETRTDTTDTGLSWVPVYVIVNGALSGDLRGESDVEALIDSQNAYNHLRSDDVDALKFNMYPQKVFVDASQDSMDKIVIAPNAVVDLSTDPSAQGRQAGYGVLESGYNYDARYEHAIERIRSDMHALLSVPDVTLEQLRGTMASGRAMRAVYWPSICRCEEKWAEWDDALKWMVNGLVDMARVYGVRTLADIPYSIKIEHLYPIQDDEEDERARDLDEVSRQARSKLSYIQKWQPLADAEGELTQIQAEQRQADAFGGAIQRELFVT